MEKSLERFFGKKDVPNGKGKLAVDEPPLFQGLPHTYMLVSYSPVSRGKAAVYKMVTLLACSFFFT